MHRISRVVIHNFRACRDVELTLAPVTPIVGQNNAGKSTILDAIQWGLSPTKLDASQFGDPSQAVEVTFEVVGLDEGRLAKLDGRHRTVILPLISGDGRLWVRRRLDEPGPPSRAVLEVCRPVEGSILTDGANGWRVNPTGIANAIAALFPEPIRIAAMLDAAADVGAAKKSNTFGKLLARLVADGELDPDAKLAGALDLIHEVLGVDGGGRAPALSKLDASLQSLVAPVFPGIELTTTLSRPSLADLLANATVRVKTHDGSDAVEFTALGHGTQRTIHVAMIRQLARQATADPASTTLLLFDEPELYLHPRGIAQVRTALRDLSNHGYQVVFTTHSPAMLEPATAANTIVASRPAGTNGTRLRLPIREAVNRVEVDAAKHVETVFELANAAEVFFSDRILLVEGGSDAITIRTTLSLIEAAGALDGALGVLEALSSNTIPKLRRVLSAMDLESVAISDLDAAWQVYQADLRELGHDTLLTDLRTAFKDLERRGLAYLGGGDAPSKKKGDPNLTAETAWTILATDVAYSDLVSALHQALRPAGIYLWPCGTLEAACGITQKGEPATRAFAAELARLHIDTARAWYPHLFEAAAFARGTQAGSEAAPG